MNGEFMPAITVYAFELYSAMEDAFVLARGKAPLAQIKELGGRVVPQSSEEIDASRLNATNRYHETPLKE